MKRFEEKWTAWLDGQLSGTELNDFDASLPDLAAAEVEKRDAQKLGAFLKEQLTAQTLSNEELFSHQIRDRISREREDLSPGRGTSTGWTIRRLAGSAATALSVSV